MTAAANPKKPARSMTYHPEIGVVYLTVGAGPCTGYYLDRAQGAPGWVWTKFGSREQYRVDPAADFCQCKGNTYHGRCKHAAATAKLVELGRIS